MPNFETKITRRQEEFSLAWLYAIASAAGYCVQDVRADVDSADAQIRQQADGEKCPKLNLIEVQLKCTYAKTPKKEKISLPISKKNYDELRGKRLVPRILVVLHVPRTTTDWLQHGDDSILLRHSAYWTTLYGQPKTKNTSSVTVSIPTTQRLTVAELKKMMNLAAKGKSPKEMI